VDRNALVRRVEARAFGDGPALEGTIQLQAEIIMQPPRGMLLDQVEWPEEASAASPEGSVVLAKSRFAR
jgi:hypothetical protein